MATRVTELVARLNNQVSQAAKDMAEDMGKAAQSSKDMSAAMDKADTTLRKVGQTATQQNKAFNGVEKATRNIESAYDRLEKRLEDAADAYAKGKISVEQYNDIQATQVSIYEKIEAREQKNIEALRNKGKQLSEVTEATDKSTQSATKNAGAIRLQSYQVVQIADEFHKWVDQVLAGGSALTATTYQLPNMVQAMGGVGNAVKLVSGFLFGPGGLVVAAGAAGLSIAKMGMYAESEQEHLTQLSTRLRATRMDYVEMADAAEKAAKNLHDNDSDLSLSDSRSAVQTIVSVPTVDSSQIERYMTDARNLAAVMGETVPEAAKTMASALQDPAKAAEEFAQQGLPGFSAGLALMVQHMQEAGNRTGALDTVLQNLEKTTNNAEEQALTPFQASLKDLKDATGGVGDAVVYSFQHMGDGIVSMAMGGIKSLTELIRLIEQIAPKVETAARSIWDSVASGMKWASGKLEGGVEGGLNLLGATNLSHVMAQGNTPDPQFSMPTNTNAMGGARGANGNSANAQSPQALKAQDAAVTSLAAHWADLQKTVDAEIGSDSSLSGQLEDQRRKVQGLKTAVAALNELHAAGKVSDAEYATDMRNYNGQLTAANVALAGLRGPFADLIEQQDRAARSAAALTGYDKAMVEASQQADDAARQLSGGLASASEKALVQAAAARTLAAEYKTNLSVIERNTQLQDSITAAWSKGGAAADHATNYVEAYNYALDHFSKNAPDFNAKVKEMADSLDALSASKRQTELSQETYANDNQVKLLNLEASTLGMNADARTKLINRMQAEDAELAKGNSLQDESVQRHLASVDAVSDATSAYEHHQQVLQDVTGSLSNMTDQLTDGITQGFLQGTSSGMSFKNMLKGIETQVVGVIAKMTLINPLLNKIDGGTRSTMDDVIKMFSQTSGSGGLSDSQIQQYMGSGSSANDNNMTAADQMSLFGNIESDASAGGVSSGGKVTASNGMSVSDIQSLFGSGKSATGSTSAFGGLSEMFSGNGGLMSSGGMEAAGTAGGAAEMGGGMFAGFGMGYSVGKMTGNLTGGGKGAKIGSAVGAGIGSVAGGIIGGPVGSMVGGVVLGAIGGLIGGALNKTHRVYDSVVGVDGQLSIGGTSRKHATDDVTAGLTTDLASVNAAYTDAGITIDDGRYGEVGHYHKGKHKRSTSLQDLLPNIKLHSDDANENLALQQIMPKTFDSVDSYTQAIASIKQLADTLDALHVSVAKFDDQTHVTVGHISGYTGELGKVLSGLDGKTISTSALESMISNLKSLLDLTNDGAQSLVSQVADLRDKYQQAADQAKVYGLDYQVILDKGNAIAQSMLDAETRKLGQSDQSVQARLLAANGNQEGADLINQQVSGDQEIQQLQDNWRSYLGDSYADNATYQQQLTDLEKTLAAERLKIQQTYASKSLAQQEQYLSQANQSVAGVFTNLASYVQSLNTSDVSPLSAEQKYHSANDNLQSDYKAAMGGDYDALSRIQSDAQTLLPLAQSYLGSGVDYAKVYNQTLNLIQSLSGMDTNKVTAALMQKLAQAQVNAQTQTTQAVQALQKALVPEIRQMVAAMAQR